MLPGPVFQVELVTTSRRRGYYAFRFLYGLILLSIVGQNYLAWDAQVRSQFVGTQVSLFALWTFGSFALVQMLAVLALTPALVAGTIANEKQRKTLHYLIASRLTGAEVVLGKLAARLLHVAVFLGIGLPVVSLLSLLGGVEPALVLLAYGGTLSTAFFLAGVSILVSVLSRRVREAIGLAYAIEFVWLVVPYIIFNLMPWGWPRMYPYVKPLNDWLLASSPMQFLGARMFMGGRAGLLEDYLWMIGEQVGLGLICVGVAVWQLRPAYRRQQGAATSRLVAIGRWRWRLFRRPECGDDPMRWKELHTSRTTGTAKLVGLLVGAALGLALAYYTGDFAWPAFKELWHSRAYGAQGYAQSEFATFLKVTCAALMMLVVLGVSTTSAGGITAEREEDTWVSLLATPLEGSSIVRAKLLGPVWGYRWIFYALGGLWLVGLAAGSLHPLGVVLPMLATAVYTWFAAALGTWLSLECRSTWRAQTLAIGALALVNGGYMVCFCPIFFEGWPRVGFGLMPMIAGGAHLSYVEARDYFQAMSNVGPWAAATDLRAAHIQTWLLNQLAYLGLAAGLTLAAFRRFDRVADRPRRPEFGPPPLPTPAPAPAPPPGTRAEEEPLVA